MDIIKKLEPERICRVCLEEKSDLYLIFDESFAEGGTPISVILNECTRYRVERHDELPHQMCGDCMESARTAHRFKRLTEQSYLTLLKVLEVKVKPPLNKSYQGTTNISTQTDNSSIHPCEICGVKFYSEVDLREHRSTDHRGSTKNCRICRLSFDTMRQLRSHLSSVHPGEGKMYEITCPLCHKPFSRKDHMKRHLRIIHKQSTTSIETELAHEVEMRQDVDTAGQDVDTTSELDCVEFKEDGDQDWGSVNDASPNGDDSLWGAIQPNEPQVGSSKNLLGNYFNCSLCSDKFLHKVHFISHMRDVHKQSAESCEEPPAGCTDISLQEPEITLLSDPRHKEVSTTLHWPGVDNGYITRDVYNAAEMDPFSLTMPQLNVKAESYQMDSSDNYFSNDYYKPNTDRSKSRVKIIREYLEKKGLWSRESSLKNPENRCLECQRTFSRHEHMMRHMLSHVTDGERPHGCPHCGKKFTRSDHLKTHVMNLHKIKEFKCDQCKLSFARNVELTRHKEARHDNRCTICQCTFLCRSHMLRHMLSHAPPHDADKSHTCSHCGEMFADVDQLNTHTMEVHPAREFKLEQDLEINSDNEGNDSN